MGKGAASGLGLTKAKVDGFLKAGLDHIQVSFQASDPELNNAVAGSRKAFEQKLAMARAVKEAGYPMVLNFVIHRHNIHQMNDIIDLCYRLDADYVELATCQYYGWGGLFLTVAPDGTALPCHSARLLPIDFPHLTAKQATAGLGQRSKLAGWQRQSKRKVVSPW